MADKTIEQQAREPKFGDWLRGIHASESNPQRDGMYVRTIRRSGRLNPGKFYECTDGKGNFWLYPAQFTTPLTRPPVTDEQVEEAAKRAAAANGTCFISAFGSWEMLGQGERENWRRAARAALGVSSDEQQGDSND